MNKETHKVGDTVEFEVKTKKPKIKSKGGNIIFFLCFIVVIVSFAFIDKSETVVETLSDSYTVDVTVRQNLDLMNYPSDEYDDYIRKVTDNVYYRHVYIDFKNKDRKRVMDYVKRFDRVALSENYLHGILPSITLAQGIIESSVGQSKLARKHNNHFGIKVGSSNLPSVVMSSDEVYNGKRKSYKSAFRTYDNAWESYRDHTLLLANRTYKNSNKKIYAKVVSAKNYKEAAKELYKAGYATGPKYASKLISIIEKYNLYMYDKILKR